MRFPKIQLKKKKEPKLKKKFTANSYSHLRSKPNRQISAPKIKLPNFSNPRVKKRFIAIPIIILFVISIFLFVTQTDVFKVTEVSFEVEASEQVEQYITNRYLGRNIFSFSIFEIEDYLKNNVENVNGAYVRKVPPNKIEIDLDFQNPAYVYATFTEVGVLTDQFQVIDVTSLEKPLRLSEFEMNLYLGIENKDAEDIEEYFFDNLTPDRREELILEKDRQNEEIEEEKDKKELWDVVSDEEKNEILQKIKGEVFAEVDAYIESVKTHALVAEYSETNLVFIFNESDISGSFGQVTSKVEFADRVLGVLEEHELKYSVARWLTDVNFQVQLENNKTLIFNDTIEKSIDNQLKDLATVIYNKELEKGGTFDFRTKNYSIY